jgi:hypothetical protein
MYTSIIIKGNLPSKSDIFLTFSTIFSKQKEKDILARIIIRLEKSSTIYYYRGVVFLRLNRFFPILLAFIFVFSFVPNLASAAVVSTTTMEKLVKSAETQSNTLVKQMSSSNAKSIKVISPKTTSTLSSAISKAKATLKGFKGKQKATFEKRLKAAEQTLIQVKTYNTTITNGTTLTNQLTTFKKTFASQPFQAEKLWTGLKAKHDQFTKDLAKLVYKNARTAFATKYQVEVKKELDSKKEFFDLNNRMVSFTEFTETNDKANVWEEFYTIDDAIYDSKLDVKLREQLFDKWYEIYYPMVSPEEEAIEKQIQAFFFALSARDVNALADLYAIGNEDLKQAIVESFQAMLAELPEGYSMTLNTIEVYFVFDEEAVAYIETAEIIDGKETIETTPIFLAKLEGHWMIIDIGEE